MEHLPVSKSAGSYATGTAVVTAIKAAARQRSHDSGEDIGTLIRRVYFDRFLCRVFATDESSFALKGGMGMLARFTAARTTRDVDLEIDDVTLDQAVAELRDLASRDLKDHLQFDYQGHRAVAPGDAQPDLVACQVQFAIYAGVSRQGSLSVDLAVHRRAPYGVEEIEPDFRLRLPKLPWAKYRVIAIEDQIADKLCAMSATYGGGRPSSRVKDLVDLAVIAHSGRPEAERLRSAIRMEAEARRLPTITQVSVPKNWELTYPALVKATAGLEVWPDLPRARAGVEAMLQPVLDGTAVGRWDPARASWAST